MKYFVVYFKEKGGGAKRGKKSLYNYIVNQSGPGALSFCIVLSVCVMSVVVISVSSVSVCLIISLRVTRNHLVCVCLWAPLCINVGNSLERLVQCWLVLFERCHACPLLRLFVYYDVCFVLWPSIACCVSLA